MKQYYIKFMQSVKSTHLSLFLIVIAALSLSQSSLGQENPEKIVEKGSSAKLIESYSSFKSDEASLIIDLLRNEVSKNPGSRGFIIVYCGKFCQYGEVEAHLRGIALALEFKGVDKNRFIIISGGFQEKTITEFWLVPSNACPPMPNSSINIKDVKFKGDYKKRIVEYECCYN